MTNIIVAGLFAGLVLAPMAALGVLDARRAIVDPRLVLALLAAAAGWRYLGPGANDGGPWTPWIGMAFGIAAVAIPIAIADWRRRRWPLYPGDAMMLGAFGFLLGPLGLAWSILLGTGFSLVYRVVLQRRRGRPIRKGLVPLGPGMTAGAAVVFLSVNFGAALAADGTAPAHDAPTAAGTPIPVTVSPLPKIPLDAVPLPATELTPAGGVLPEAVATRELAFEQRDAVSFPATVRRLSSLSGVNMTIEERPARIYGGTAILTGPAPIRLVWHGAFAGLLNRLSAVSGYDWDWQDGTVVFYRYWDIEQRAAAPADSPGPADERAAIDAWIVEAGTHKTLRGVIGGWARRAGWTLVWNSNRDYAVGPVPVGADRAVFRGGFLEAVDLLLAGNTTRRVLTALAYKANRHLVIEDTGAAGP
ncbi:MAG: TcpQ domain-containing protein [Rhodospirillales bacterium]|nr:TcpQ domain-containing protein [Rhodospirillales bacterium]